MLSCVSIALPVLRETKADFSGKLATIYPDHQDPNLYYFLPDSSEFAKNSDGTPVVTLIHWGLQSKTDLSDGGGMFNFVLRTAVTPQFNEELIIFAKKHPGSHLAVIPFAASFIALGRGPQENWRSMIQAVDLPVFAGVAESEIGVNILLTELGARVFKKSIETNADYNIQLCFKVDGITPMMYAKIEMDYRKIYQFFHAQASAGELLWDLAVAAELRKLYRNGTIKIQIIGGDATIEDLIMELAREMISAWFFPKNNSDDILGGFVQLNFNYSYQEMRSLETFELKKSVLITDDRCINLSLKGLSHWAKKIVAQAD